MAHPVVPTQPPSAPASPEETPARPARAAPPGPLRCPACGRPYDLFWLPGSQLLDLVEVAKLALTDLQAAIEEEVLP